MGFWAKLFPRKERRAAPHAGSIKKDAATETLLDASLRDAVTNLYNRKHLIERLDASMARCARSQEMLAVILWDIDGFVDFNNRFGQEEGDKFLKKVSDIIRRSIRSYDEAFRSGGDDFCAILIPADAAVAKEVTERVQKAVSKDLFQGKAEYAGREFSISSGMVFYPSERPAGEIRVAEALLHEAGQDLYRNRNKVGV